MRKIYILIFALQLLSGSVFSQETKEVNRRISKHLTATYVVDAETKVKSGSYLVKNEQNVVLVRGVYQNDKKTGKWYFFSDKGVLVQQYDFDNAKLIYFALDPQSILKSTYKVPNTDRLSEEEYSVPIKIGGEDYLFFLLFDESKLPTDLKTVTDGVKMIYTFDIDEKGRLTKWTTNYESKYYNKTEKNAIKSLPSDVYEFIPAKVKGQAVNSVIYLETTIGVNNMQMRPAYNNIPKSAN